MYEWGEWDGEGLNGEAFEVEFLAERRRRILRNNSNAARARDLQKYVDNQ